MFSTEGIEGVGAVHTDLIEKLGLTEGLFVSHRCLLRTPIALLND